MESLSSIYTMWLPFFDINSSITLVTEDEDCENMQQGSVEMCIIRAPLPPRPSLLQTLNLFSISILFYGKSHLSESLNYICSIFYASLIHNDFP